MNTLIVDVGTTVVKFYLFEGLSTLLWRTERRFEQRRQGLSVETDMRRCWRESRGAGRSGGLCAGKRPSRGCRRTDRVALLGDARCGGRQAARADDDVAGPPGGRALSGAVRADGPHPRDLRHEALFRLLRAQNRLADAPPARGMPPGEPVCGLL